MNKKGILIRDWLLALLLFSVVIALFAIGSADLASDYGMSRVIDSDFRDKYDEFSNVTQDVATIQEDLTSDEGLDIIGTVGGIFKVFYTLIGLIFGSFFLVGSQTANFAMDYGVPEVVANLIFPFAITAITIIIIFVIISALQRSNKL